MKLNIKHKAEKSAQLVINLPKSLKDKIAICRSEAEKRGIDFTATAGQVLDEFVTELWNQMTKGQYADGNLSSRSENHHSTPRA